MQTLKDIAPYVAVGAAALSLVLLVLVIVLATRVARLRRAQTVVLGHHEQRDIVEHTEDLDAQVRNLREAVEILTDQLDEQKVHLEHALTRRAIVRYDAFRDAGGEQSASFALLDDAQVRRRLQRHRRARLRAHLRQARHRRGRRPRPLARRGPGHAARRAQTAGRRRGGPQGQAGAAARGQAAGRAGCPRRRPSGPATPRSRTSRAAAAGAGRRPPPRPRRSRPSATPSPRTPTRTPRSATTSPGSRRRRAPRAAALRPRAASLRLPRPVLAPLPRRSATAWSDSLSGRSSTVDQEDTGAWPRPATRSPSSDRKARSPKRRFSPTCPASCTRSPTRP